MVDRRGIEPRSPANIRQCNKNYTLGNREPAVIDIMGDEELD